MLSKQVVSVAETLREKHHLSDNRERIQLFSHPPNTELKCPEIVSDIVKDQTKKTSDTVQLTTDAHINTCINEYPDEWIHVYTDRSAFEGTMNAGYGALILYSENQKEQLSSSVVPCAQTMRLKP